MTDSLDYGAPNANLYEKRLRLDPFIFPNSLGRVIN